MGEGGVGFEICDLRSEIFLEWGLGVRGQGFKRDEEEEVLCLSSTHSHTTTTTSSPPFPPPAHPFYFFFQLAFTHRRFSLRLLLPLLFSSLSLSLSLLSLCSSSSFPLLKPMHTLTLGWAGLDWECGLPFYFVLYSCCCFFSSLFI